MGGNQSRCIDEKMNKELSTLKAQLEALRKEFRRTHDFKDHLQAARECLLRCKEGRRVVVILGTSGAGKSTLAQFLFEVEDAHPVESGKHGLIPSAQC
jgi:ABC-type glutathione transport system ATPase component